MVKLKADFFFVWSVLFLLIVIIGFIPSFILRPLFTDRGIPFYLTFHGIVMIAWFVGVFLQSLLIARGRILDHMKYGRYWFVLAMFLLLTNTQVMISISNEVMKGEESYYGVIRNIENTGPLVLANLYLTLCTMLMFLVSYFKRHVSKVHKRALFGACVFLVAPAFDRFMRPFNLEDLHPILNFLILLHLIPISLIIHDLVKSRKVYVISAIALILLVLGLPVITLGIKHGFDVLLVEFLG